MLRFTAPPCLLLFQLWTFSALPTPHAYTNAATPSHGAVEGLAWKVTGHWKDGQTGAQITAGVGIDPGSLLMPGAEPGAHSLTVLLPDGQRVLSECFTADDCSRGFRVPALVETPSRFAVEMLNAIRGVIEQAHMEAGAGGQMTLPRQEELVAELIPKTDAAGAISYKIKLQGLLASLPDGGFTYTLRHWDGPPAERVTFQIRKASSGCTFPVPGPGLYRLSIFDSLNTERVDLLVAAVGAGQTQVASNFDHAKQVLTGWDERYNGWPVHELLRAYLHSLEK